MIGFLIGVAVIGLPVTVVFYRNLCPRQWQIEYRWTRATNDRWWGEGRTRRSWMLAQHRRLWHRFDLLGGMKQWRVRRVA